MAKQRVWLCLSPALFCLLDAGLTLWGQSDAYWGGQFVVADEWNPLGRWPLQRHPLCFVAAVSAWVLAFCSLVWLLPDNLARPLSFAVQLGHTAGAASWVLRLTTPGWVACVVLLVGSRILLGYAWEQTEPSSLSGDKPSGGSPIPIERTAGDGASRLPGQG